MVSVEDYLHTSFDDGDREYIDGVIVERHVGERPHSWMQQVLCEYFGARRATLRTYSFPEQRLQVKPARFRVPDICIYLGGMPGEDVFTKPPFLAIEILSREDRPKDLKEKIQDYLDFDTRFIWVVNPRTGEGYTVSAEGTWPGLHTNDPDIVITHSEIIAMIAG